MALTGKQQAFVKAYLDGGMSNAAEAYRVAYPTSRKWANQIVAIKASQLVSHDKISIILSAARAKAARAMVASVDRFVVSKERISRELARMAFADARKLYKWDADKVTLIASEHLSDDDAAAVVAVSHTVTDKGGTLKLTMGDKRQALMDLAKLHGHIVDRKDIRVIRTVDDLTDDELATLANEKGNDDVTRH
jgi:hypothetical protein